MRRRPDETAWNAFRPELEMARELQEGLLAAPATSNESSEA